MEYVSRPSVDDFDDGDDSPEHEPDYAHYLESHRLPMEDPTAYDYFEDDDLEYFDDAPPDALSQLRFLWTDCTLPIFTQSLTTAAPLVLLSVALPLLGGFAGDLISILHLSSAGLGLAALLVFFPESWHILLAIVIVAACLSYFVSKISPLSGRLRTLSLSASLWGAAVYFELTMDGPIWHTLRGPALLVAMKVLSVAIDEESLKWEELLGYLLCPGTAIFGPWIKFSEYVALIEGSSRRRRRRWPWRWLSSLLFSLAASFLALFISVCVASVLLSQIEPPTAMPRGLVSWLAAYRDALSFRTSHYYVCFTSRAMLMAIGAGMEEEEEYLTAEGKGTFEENSNQRPRRPAPAFKTKSLLEITNPLRVELPRSLVDVVVHWNVPTHRWLKNYVFRPARLVVGTPLAILATYAISALLHGLNFQLAAVLFSLGLYSYVEHVLRGKLARIFDACIAARACGDCRHARGKNEWWVKLANLLFGLVAVFHLAYLGVGFDNSDGQSRGYSMSHVVDKWSGLSYASHIVAFVCGVFSLLI